jgi:hypothetical protein
VGRGNARLVGGTHKSRAPVPPDSGGQVEPVVGWHQRRRAVGTTVRCFVLCSRGSWSWACGRTAEVFVWGPLIQHYAHLCQCTAASNGQSIFFLLRSTGTTHHLWVELQCGTRPTLRFSEKTEYPPTQSNRDIEPSGRGNSIEPSSDIKSGSWTRELGLLGFQIGMEPSSQHPLSKSQAVARCQWTVASSFVIFFISSNGLVL